MLEWNPKQYHKCFYVSIYCSHLVPPQRCAQRTAEKTPLTQLHAQRWESRNIVCEQLVLVLHPYINMVIARIARCQQVTLTYHLRNVQRIQPLTTRLGVLTPSATVSVTFFLSAFATSYPSGQNNAANVASKNKHTRTNKTHGGLWLSFKNGQIFRSMLSASSSSSTLQPNAGYGFTQVLLW